MRKFGDGLQLKILTTGLIFALSGCGGSNSNVIDPSSSGLVTLATFLNDDAIISGTTRDGNRLTAIVDDRNDFLFDANYTGLSPVTQSGVSSLPLDSNFNSSVQVRKGTLSVWGIQTNVTVYESNDETASLVDLKPNGGNYMVTIGTPYTKPPTGTYTYSGLFAVSHNNAWNKPVNQDWKEFGTLSLTASFDQNWVTVGGATSNYTFSAQASMNSNTGFYTGTGRLVGQSSSDAVTVYGDFHGTNASSVTGVFHTNDGMPDIYGGWVGQR